jgi:hypothetical protein
MLKKSSPLKLLGQMEPNFFFIIYFFIFYFHIIHIIHYRYI